MLALVIVFMLREELPGMADRLEKIRVAGLEAELEGLRSNRDTVVAATARTEETLAQALGEVTNHIRIITEKLNNRAPAELN